MDIDHRAIFLDIDGCLTSPDGSVSTEYFQSLCKISELVRSAFVARHPRIFLCSGRDRNCVEFAANLLGINDWTIVEGGAALFHSGTREVKFNPAITEKTRKLFKWIGSREIPKVLKVFNAKSTVLQVYSGYMVCHSLERVANSQVSIDSILNFLRPQHERGAKRPRGGLLTKLVGRKLIKVSAYFNRAVNIVPAGVSKGSAARFLAELEGIDLSSSLAIGDSEHDFSVFRHVGLVGCPSNATEGCRMLVKQRKGYVSLKNYAEGVVETIDFFKCMWE